MVHGTHRSILVCLSWIADIMWQITQNVLASLATLASAALPSALQILRQVHGQDVICEQNLLGGVKMIFLNHTILG